ncbi:MAG: glutamate--tRNA ligase, partial [Clostridia bacterium]|nr:glutamate--tRNA ligase [Clostridia bacterium]
LKEAVLNYIALLGWSPGGEQEIFTLEEMIEAFDIRGISKSPAIFDPQKLDWLNAEYIRKLSPEAFYEKALPYLKEAIKREDVDLLKAAKLLHDRTEKLSDIPEQLDFIDVLPEYDPALYCHKKMKTNEENSLTSLKEILPVLEGIADWNYDALHEALFSLIEKLEVKNGLILWPLRVAVSGKSFTPGGGIELAELLGKEETLARIKKGIELLSK